MENKKMSGEDLYFLAVIDPFTDGGRELNDMSEVEEWRLVAGLSLAKGFARIEDTEEGSESVVAMCLKIFLYEYVRRHGQDEAKDFIESLCA